MKKHISSLLLVCALMTAAVSCKKNADVTSSEIDPADASRLCRALLVSGNNLSAGLPDSTANTPYINKGLISALVTNDNTLFLSFTAQTANAFKGMFLSVEGADNHWNIPLTASSSATRVIALGIPANVLNGSFRLVYRLYDNNGKVGNKVTTIVNIKDPIEYCKTGGSTLGTRNGNDGVDAMRFNLGDQPGWVTIRYDMLTIKDRMDIKYNGKYIRSTGALLGVNSTPPIGRCSDVGVNGDGFVSGTGTFTFFYDPAVSRRVDIYVSGCLDGGTAWNYTVMECPKNLPTLGIHSNWEEGGSLTSGHAWISLTENAQTTFWGLWPDGHPLIAQNGLSTNPAETDVRKNLEKGRGSHSRYYQLTTAQLQTIKNILNENKNWQLAYNCSSLVEEIVNRSGADNVTFNDPGALYTAETPRMTTRYIVQKEGVDPSTYTIPGSSDHSSCSFCF